MDVIDPAILRRLSCKFHVGLPDTAQREAIFHVILRDESVATDINYAALARATNGCSGDDIKEICRIAAMSALGTAIDGIPPSARGCPGLEDVGMGMTLRSITQADLAAAVRAHSVGKRGGDAMDAAFETVLAFAASQVNQGAAKGSKGGKSSSEDRS